MATPFRKGQEGDGTVAKKSSTVRVTIENHF